MEPDDIEAFDFADLDDGDARADFADSLPDLDNDVLGEIDAAQWHGAFEPFFESGQITEEQLEALIALGDDWESIVLDLYAEVPDGDTL